MVGVRLIDIDADGYQRHPLHATDRIWGETNCYADVWIEVLHALGREPLAGCAFTLASDFEGDQWTFFKFPPEDLRSLYGVRVFEMNPWRGTLDHVVEHLAMGRLMTIEVDSWYLPDTAGVSYRIEHVKTTIVPNFVDIEHKRLGYFHGASYYELEGEDFNGVFRLAGSAQAGALPPYMETIRLEGLRDDDLAAMAARSRDTLRSQVSQLPADNPIPRFRARLEHDLPWLREAGIDGFHRWAFSTFRQCGASAELGASYLDWLARTDDDPAAISAAAQNMHAIAQACKSLEFSLARLARGRAVDVDATFDAMTQNWSNARDTLVARYGS